MTALGALHTLAAVTALASGAWVLVRRKGTRAHRRAGWTYAASMLALNASALLIYRLTGRFGAFHVAALASLATVVAGIVPAWRRRPAHRWLERHYFFMTYSYVGLAAAAVSEVATRLPVVHAIAGGPTTAFWIAVAVASAVVFVAGALIVRRSAAATLQPFHTAPRPGGAMRSRDGARSAQ